MTTFTIDSDNSITAFPSLEEAQAAGLARAEYFSSQEELTQLAASWPIAGTRRHRSSKLRELLNSLPGFDASQLRGEQQVLPSGKDPMGLAFSADGKTALLANHGDGTVSIIDLPRMQVTGKFHAGTGIETLAYY